MKQALVEKIKQQLIKLPFKVEAAVIYGSWARGEEKEESDIDLLVISNEVHPRKNKRGREIALIKEKLSLGIPLDILLLTEEECISNFKHHNPLFLDIAWEGFILLDVNNLIGPLIDEVKIYILDKGLKKLDDGWVFPVVDRIPTYLCKVSHKDFAWVMLSDGERDYRIGLKIMEEGFFDKAVYHFQQSVEKAVKSVLICFGIFKKTHFIGTILLEEIKNRDIEANWKSRLSEIARISEEMEPEVTWSRYPGIDKDTLWIPYEEYILDDAKEYAEKSKHVLDIAKGFFIWWFK